MRRDQELSARDGGTGTSQIEADPVSTLGFAAKRDDADVS
jgi:hypothetical protein